MDDTNIIGRHCLKAAHLYENCLMSKCYVKLIDKIDEDQDTGYMYVGTMLSDDTVIEGTRLAVCYTITPGGHKSGALVAIHKGCIKHMGLVCHGPKWAALLRPYARQALAEIAAGYQPEHDDCHIDMTKSIDEPGRPAIVPTVPTKQRKDVIDVLREAYELVPDRPYWSLLRDAVGDRFNEDISNDELMELVFGFAMERVSEKLAVSL